MVRGFENEFLTMRKNMEEELDRMSADRSAP
jgi:hypothetical protein